MPRPAILVAVLCLLLTLPVVGDTAITPVAPELFGRYSNPSQDTALSLKLKDNPTVMRSRPVSVYFDAMSPDSKAGGQANRLHLSLFSDADYTAVLDRIEKNPSGSQTWIGHIEGIDLSQVVLVQHNGVLSGNISMPGAFYQVRYVEDGIHSIRQIDHSKFPESDDAIVPPESQIKASPDATPMSDDGSTVDVMVVYTPSARTAVGGTAAMNSLIDLAVAETNTSYRNSGINHRLRLVHRTEVNYTEQSFSADLNNLTRTSDGYMDNIHSLRTQYGADEVVLLINNASSCGLAWLMTNVSTSFASSAFAVAHHDCATGYYSFGHEIGHNMGARHDRYVDNGDTPYATSHGYVNTSAQWRTIMAYNDKCADLGFNCTRIQYWSNPNVTYQGSPMGIAAGNASAADNRTTLNNTAFTVANFMTSTVVSTPASLAINGSSSVEGGVPSSYSATVTYTDGISSTITPTWSVSPSTNASISTSGVLTTTGISNTQTLTIAASYTANGVTVTATKSVTVVVPTPASLSISGVSSVAGGASATYTATATLTSGNTATVTPTWSVSPNTYASISASGVLTTTSVRAVQTPIISASYTANNVTVTASQTVTINPPPLLSLTKRTGIVSPYWQADVTSYTFISVSHPSLVGMASSIGVLVTAVSQNGVAQGVSEFTVNADTTSKLFIVGTNNPYINPTTLPGQNLMVLGSSPVSGQLRFTPTASHPETITNSGGNSDGLRIINSLSLWGAIIAMNTSTGFAMEFIGDLADSRNPVSGTTLSAGVN